MVSESMWVSISWTSKRTLERGVERSNSVSCGLLVARTNLFANDGAENDGSRKAS